MKNNGFTLIELLTVIIILAVLVLIATPVVLLIIDDTNESKLKANENVLYYNLSNSNDNTYTDEYSYCWGYWSLTTNSYTGYVKFVVHPACSPNSSDGIGKDYQGETPFSGGVRPIITFKL